MRFRSWFLCLTIGVALILYIVITALISIYEASFIFDINEYKNIDFFLLESDSTETLVPYNFLPETDYNKLIDIRFYFTSIQYPCATQAPLLLVLIKTSPANSARRKIIRETWGQEQEDVKVLFLLGAVTSAEVKTNLSTENRLHNDIIQGSFLDIYRNLTYKTIMGLKYVVYHCSKAKYVLTTDDDTFVNMPLLKNFLIHDLSPFGAEKLLMCYVIHKARSMRSFRSKWRVTFDEYEYKHYPTYCLGWATLYSPDVVFAFYREAQRNDYFWIEDVFTTGFSAFKSNFFNHVDITALTLSRREVNNIKPSKKYRPFLFGCADLDSDEILYLWEYVLDNPVPKSIEWEMRNKL